MGFEPRTNSVYAFCHTTTDLLKTNVFTISLVLVEYDSHE
jgi:hypothetical protein